MFDFYYGNEAEQFTFLRVPKFLFTDDAFAALSSDAKILYSLMLDRMGLSVKNGWLDEQNRVYIIFTHEEAQKSMNCGGDKCTKIFRELEEIGLIYRKKRGMGRPAIIYVKNFVRESNDNSDNETTTAEEDIKTSENQDSRLRENRSQDSDKSEVLTTENQDSRVMKNRSHDFGKIGVIKNNNIKTEYIETDDQYQSYQSIPRENALNSKSGLIDEIDKQSETKKSKLGADRNYWLSVAMENASYDVLKEKYSDSGMELAEEILNIIADVLCGLRKVYISGNAVPAEIARSRFMLLTFEHIEYVIDSLADVRNKITKPDAYICAALYNSTYTLNISTFAGFTANTGIQLVK